MSSQPLQPEEFRVTARYQQELAQANDRAVRYAALADALADRADMLEEQLRKVKAELAVAHDKLAVAADDAARATARKVTKE